MSERDTLRAAALRAIAKSPPAALASPAAAAALPARAKADLVRALSAAAAWTDALLPPAFFAGVPALRVLSFAACSTLSPAFILAVARAAPALLGLDLTSCFHMSDAAVAELLRALPRLRFLGLADCRQLTSGTTDALVRLGGSLRHVDLGGCGGLTRADVCTFLARHPGAADFSGLGLSGTEGLDGEAMRIIGARFKRLARLSAGYYCGDEAPLLAAITAVQATLVALELHWPRLRLRGPRVVEDAWPS